jgi:surfeit locus 1 family protein
MTEARAPARGRFPIGLTLTVAVCLVILLGLGVWQLQRLKWKEGILAHVAALQTARAVDVGPVLDRLARGADVDFTRVTANCPGLASAPFLQLYAIRDQGQGGQAGWRLISACPVDSAAYRTILVDRGFIPDTVQARPQIDPAQTAPVAVTGILRKPDRPSFIAARNRPGRWFVRDVPAMARALGAPQPAPDFLYAETSSNPAFKPLDPFPLPANIPNRHFEYALTWFGLAAGLLGVYVAALVARMRG